MKALCMDRRDFLIEVGFAFLKRLLRRDGIRYENE